MSSQPVEIDASAVTPEDVTEMVKAASDEQLAEVMSGPQRDAIVAEVFRRMGEHFRADDAGDLNTVIHWKIGGRPGGGDDHWEVVISDGSCAATDEPKSEPRVTLKLDGPNFLRLISGNASGPVMFMTQKLKIDGDITFAARVPSLFDIPS
jgi:putative sterol carrier protein